MNKLELIKKILEVQDEKKKHLEDYSKAIGILAKTNDPMIFLTGKCESCEKYDAEILSLESQLKPLLND